jgi:predicted lipoprotein with Yx(FWY)xxD motif
MRHPKIIIAGVSLAVVAAGGGIAAASVSGSPAARVTVASANVRTASTTVGGKTETILVNGRGLPLYYYRPDTATQSLVTGALAQLWPPLTSAAPAAAEARGKLAVLNDVNGRQVTYNGHPLYTFANDHADQVTGQGVQDFFVATPGLAPITASAAPAPAAPSGGSHGY